MLTIRDIDQRDDLELMTDFHNIEFVWSQLSIEERVEIVNTFGKVKLSKYANRRYTEYPCSFFVEVVDGEYGDIFAFSGDIPYMDKDLLQVRGEIKPKCDSCELMMINGVLCHESGCRESYKFKTQKCAWCGMDFQAESEYQACCNEECEASYRG